MPNIIDKKVLHEIDVTTYFSHHKTDKVTLQATSRAKLTEKMKELTENPKPETELIDFDKYRTITTAEVNALNKKKWFTDTPKNNLLRDQE